MRSSPTPGPNGAGKSTTVKLLSSVLAPTAGTVRCLGMDPMAERVPYVRRIGVVFGQRTELWWDQPVAASFEWKRVVWEIPRPRYEEMLAFVKELLGIGEFFHTLARQLSLGQKMRADIALMLLHEPEILFLDEPTIGLDVLAKRTILDFIRTLNRERGVTVMLTSHDMDELEQLAGRIVLIDRGRIAYDGDFTDLRRRFGDRRQLTIETAAAAAPRLDGVRFTGSDGQSPPLHLRRRPHPDHRPAAAGVRPDRHSRRGDPPLAHRRRHRRHLPGLERQARIDRPRAQKTATGCAPVAA